MPHINSTKILDTVVKPQKKAVLASSKNAVFNLNVQAEAAAEQQFVGIMVDNDVMQNVAVPPVPKVEVYREDGIVKLRYVP